MKCLSLEQWVKIYENKTNDRVTLGDECYLFYLARRGFIVIKPDAENKTLIIKQTCGDGKFWIDFAEIKALELDFDHLATVTCRAIKPYLRFFGFSIKEIQHQEELVGYICTDSIGRNVEAIPSGENEYLITLDLKNNQTNHTKVRGNNSE